MPPTLAIDFGTSNSAAGAVIDGQPRLIALEPGQMTMPTAVFFGSREILFGTPAQHALIEGQEGRYMRALKSILGTSLMHETRSIMGRRRDFSDIIRDFLAEVKRRAEAETGTTFTHALSGRPVHFHGSAARDKQALADLTACYHAAGFEHVSFMPEPEAAALAHDAVTPGEVGLIVDIGGGTSDFTLFRAGKDTISVLGSHGIRLGGTNFDRRLSIDHVMPLLGAGAPVRNTLGGGTLAAPNTLFHELATWETIPFVYAADTRRTAADLARQAVNPTLFKRLLTVLDEQLGHDIAFAVERAKIAANTMPEAEIDLHLIEPDLAASLSAAMLSASLSDHGGRVADGARYLLDQSGCDPADISTIIFVGGASLMRFVEDEMRRLLPRAACHRAEAFTAVIDGLTRATIPATA